MVSVKWSRTCMLSCPVSWTAKKPNWFYPGCYPDCFLALMMHDECAASNRFPSAWIRRRRRPPENAVGANGRKINREINKTKKPCKANLAGLIWWSVLDSNRLPTAWTRHRRRPSANLHRCEHAAFVKKKPCKTWACKAYLVVCTGLEPVTPSMWTMCSTNWANRPHAPDDSSGDRK